MTNYCPRFASTVNRQRPTITRWCGPGILSVLSGEDYDDIERRVNALRGRPPHTRVKGMMVGEMKDISDDMGLIWIYVHLEMVRCRTTEVDCLGNELRIYRRPTLIRWLRDTRKARGEDVYVIMTADHVLLVKGEWIVDNCLRTPTPYELIKYRRRVRVLGSYCILKDEEIEA